MTGTAHGATITRYLAAMALRVAGAQAARAVRSIEQVSGLVDPTMRVERKAEAVIGAWVVPAAPSR